MTLLEVERKFGWSLANLKTLVSNQGHPPFFGIHGRRPTSFHDVYYDSHDKLSRNGLWVRKRAHYNPSSSVTTANSAVWEAKQATPRSSFNRSTYEETQDICRIQQMINKHIPGCHSLQESFGLKPTYSFATFRQTFLADDKFTIVLDQTDFGHSTGEVELFSEDEEKAHADIDGFLKRYQWFFDCSKPKGKLTAYIEQFATDTSREGADKDVERN